MVTLQETMPMIIGGGLLGNLVFGAVLRVITSGLILKRKNRIQESKVHENINN